MFFGLLLIEIVYELLIELKVLCNLNLLIALNKLNEIK